MERAILEWLTDSEIPEHAGLRLQYTIYGCMLLLNAKAFEHAAWHEIEGYCNDEDFERLYSIIARHMKVTHIALNKPIPLHEDSSQAENVLRAPSNFTPLFGDFGPVICSSAPTQGDFDAAFWVTAKQNGVFQIWAPRWTMFSRGNISEKARLLTLPSVQTAVDQGKADGRGCAAIDLYAGIGYFAFSYLKAGFDKVLCWDLNPWSIEGLKRGAGANKWAAASYTEEQPVEDLAASDARLLIFNESNNFASDRVRQMRSSLPPIRHVNCGLLPTSRGSWQIAVEVLDPVQGGWMHVHENFAVAEINEKAEEVRLAFANILKDSNLQRQVEIEDIHRVKSYAPGVMHCVIDLYIPPCNQ